MRFAYIDSQGKEVGIPSVDALQLRIELGAIGRETMFFDARTGKWARAAEHEIFRTLIREVRDAREEKAFPGAGSPERPEDAPGEATRGADTTTDAPDVSPSVAGSETDESSDVLEPATLLELTGVADDETEELDGFDLSAFEPNEPDLPGSDELFLGGSELQLEDDAGEDLGGSELQLEDDAGEDLGVSELWLEDDAGADLGGSELQLDEAGEDPGEAELQLEDGGDDMGGSQVGRGLELDDRAPPSVEEPEPDPVSDERSSGSGGGGSPPGWFEAGPEEDELQLEEAWKAGASSAAGPGAGVADVPRPGAADSEGTSHGAAGDMGGGGRQRAEGGGSVTERPTRQAPGAAPDDEGSGPVRGASRPAASTAGRPPAKGRSPGRRRGPGSGSRIAVVALLVIAGAGGWFGWSTLRGDVGTEEMEAAVLPELPPELEELHAQAVPGAVEALVETLRQDAASLPGAPDEGWLGGEYLATASAFPAVEDYWTSLGEYLRRARAREAEIFANAYALELERLPVPGPSSRERLVQRAEVAFRAARPERGDAYDRLDTLIAASLDLHEFLRANEERITYEPTAGGFSRDPVTEAIPATQELGDEMWSRVSRITAAMDALGTVDRLTTQGLVDFVLMRVGRAPVR